MSRRRYRLLPDLRGGGSLAAAATTTAAATTNNDDDDTNNNSNNKTFRRERGMAVALFATYFAVMGAKCALPSVLSLLTSPTTGLSFDGWMTTTSSTTPQQLMAKQLTLSTLAVALGKLVLGPVIDVVGGIRSLQISLLLLMFLLGTISTCRTFTTFAVCWVLVDFIFSSCWAGCIQAVRQTFPKHEWARRVGMLAAAARTGNATAFVVFGLVLHWAASTTAGGVGGGSHGSVSNSRLPWRLVFASSAMLQLVPLTLLSIFGTKYQQQQENKLSTATAVGEEESIINNKKQTSMSFLFQTLRQEAATPAFWLHLVSRSALMVFGSFLLFVPTFMSGCFSSSPSVAAQTGSLFALGCLLSVTVGSSWYGDALSDQRHKALCVACLLGVATAVALCLLAHVSSFVFVRTLSARIAACLFFVWGAAFSLPFYIPPSLYALSRGAASATIADVFDFAGFGLLAVFNGYVASIPHDDPAAWIPTFQLLSACAATALVALAFAVLLEDSTSTTASSTNTNDSKK